MDLPWVDQLLSDLERQAASERLADRDVEVEQRSHDAYRSVPWAGRLRASRGATVSATVLGYGPVTGTVDLVGRDWCLVRSAEVDLVVLLDAVQTIRGLRDAVVEPEDDPVWSRLGLGAALREAIEERRTLRVFLRDGSRVEGPVLRAGADFCEFGAGLVSADGPASAMGALVVPWLQMAAFTAR